ncbi:DUF2125 domain-containing protein [Rubellimicrobium aerolatum]|uniref:DUF2125 domain-containing protein n=1 Tax=Rubellimicrobium aerolatum TaxID=490979 RepID=A0ABW0SDH0_9RHOB|nr:DUF2125 domain-containing protein [Rubellimicrobium aerolatum]MBP1805735.1 hypothetical protein [Rubellimicrobium aerolatum]
MRVLFFVVAGLAALYAGYWFVGSSQVEAGARAALAGMEARGWEVEYADLSTTGFPSRFDTTVTELRATSPDGVVRWAAPFVQVFALSYRPNQVIVVGPPEQTVTVAGQDLGVTADGLRASATVGWSTALPLDHAAVESGPLAVVSDGGWSLSLDRLLGAVRMAGPGANSYDLFLEGTGIVPAGLPERFGSLGLDQLRFDGQVVLDAPIDRRLAVPPRATALTVRSLRIAQGDVALGGTGELAPDAQGFLAGRITLTVENWRGLLDRLEAAGLLPFARGSLVERGLEQASRGGANLELPVTLAEGQVRALGVTLFDAPRVR